MNAKTELNNKIDKLNENFDRLISDNELNINSIENLAIGSVNDIKNIINAHLKELIDKRVNEKELITKKNKSGKKEDLN